MRTGQHPAAGTNANVMIKVVGSKGETNLIHLNQCLNIDGKSKYRLFKKVQR